VLLRARQKLLLDLLVIQKRTGAEADGLGADEEAGQEGGELAKLSVSELWSMLSHGAEQVFDPTLDSRPPPTAGEYDAMLDAAPVRAEMEGDELVVREEGGEGEEGREGEVSTKELAAKEEKGNSTRSKRRAEGLVTGGPQEKKKGTYRKDTLFQDPASGGEGRARAQFAGALPTPAAQWACAACTLVNASTVTICEVCETPRPYCAPDAESTRVDSTRLDAAPDPLAKRTRTKTSFMFFSIETRPRLMDENPKMRFGDLAKELGRLWTELDTKAKVQ
jgi:hypothetical protein